MVVFGIYGLIITAALGWLGYAIWQARPAHADVINSTDFVTTWKTDTADTGDSCDSCIELPTSYGGYTYNYDVDWDNDGIFDELGLVGDAAHDYGVPGEYTVRIRGDYPTIGWSDGASDDDYKLLSVDQWGSVQWESMQHAFHNASNLVVTASDTPDLSNVTSMRGMFYGASSLTGDFSNWNVSNVTDMEVTFQNAALFNSDISGWDVGNVTDMDYMFFNAQSFNQNLGSWNMSSVLSLNLMLPFSGTSVDNYEAMLQGWALQPLQSNVSAGGGMTYCKAQAAVARQYIIDTFSWNFNGNVQYCGTVAFSDDGSSSVTLATDSPSGTVLDTLTTSYFTPTSYSLSCTVPGADDSFFAIGGSNNDELITTAALDFNNTQDSDGNNEYHVCVKATDDEGREAMSTLYVTVLAAPSVSSINPSDIPLDGEIHEVTIHGDNLEATEVKFGSSIMAVTSNDEYEILVQVPTDGISPGTVDVTITHSNGAVTIVPNGFTYGQAPKAITGVSFSEDAGKKLMTITGTKFFEDDEFLEGSQRSLISLNGDELPFCTNETYTSEVLIGIGFNPERFNDNPPCYYLVSAIGNPLISATQASIWLPSDFNTSAPGTVSVNGSPVFAFGTATAPVVPTPVPAVNNGNRPSPFPAVLPTQASPPVTVPADEAPGQQPSVGVSGEDGEGNSDSLANNPIISTRPTFTGKAAPGARIKVTVHSDPVICETTADENGDWSCTLDEDLPDGKHTVYVSLTNTDGTTTELGPYAVRVGETVTDKTKTEPASDTSKTDAEDGSNLLVRLFPFVVGGVLAIIAAVFAIRRASRSS